MKAAERLEEIKKKIIQSSEPISGNVLSKEFGVSRQIIVKDIAALKENGMDIIATTKGYVLHRTPYPERIYKVVHRDDEIREELEAIIKTGGATKNVFVWHKVYGKIEAPLDISTFADINEYMLSLENGRSSPLKNVTSEYHYHTITAPDTETLDKIEEVLDSLGFLVKDE